MNEWTKGKLNTLEEIKANSPKISYNGPYEVSIYHTKINRCIDVEFDSVEYFGNIIDVKVWVRERGSRVIYKDIDNNLYYDEWFEWIGEELPIVKPIPDHLWDISDW
jgi:hypothetical protein